MKTPLNKRTTVTEQSMEAYQDFCGCTRNCQNDRVLNTQANVALQPIIHGPLTATIPSD